LQDVLKDALDNNVQSVAEMPYFEGDFWPNVIEESIKELDREEAEKRLREEAEAAATEADDFDTDSVDLTEVCNILTHMNDF
jgi:E1A/CREB-binding protein